MPTISRARQSWKAGETPKRSRQVCRPRRWRTWRRTRRQMALLSSTKPKTHPRHALHNPHPNTMPSKPHKTHYRSPLDGGCPYQSFTDTSDYARRHMAGDTDLPGELLGSLLPLPFQTETLRAEPYTCLKSPFKLISIRTSKLNLNPNPTLFRLTPDRFKQHPAQIWAPNLRRH